MTPKMVIGIALTVIFVGGIAAWWLILEIRQADRRQEEALAAELAGLRAEVQRLRTENTARGAEVQRLQALTQQLRVDKQAFEQQKQAYLSGLSSKFLNKGETSAIFAPL